MLERKHSLLRSSIVKKRFLFLMFCGALLFSPLSQGQEWPRFRGADGTGLGKGESIPVSFDQSDHDWHVDLPGPGHSSPVLWGNKLFLNWARDEEGKRGLVCLDARTGKQNWSWETTFEAYRHHRDNSFAASTPVLDESRAYLSWISGERFIVEAVSHEGNPVWRRDLGAFSGRHGAGASPIVISGTVIAGNDNRTADSFLVGLDAATGKTRWKHERKSEAASYVTPTPYYPDDGPVQVIFCSPPHGISSINPEDGALNWETGGIFILKSVASPVVAGDLIFATAGRGGGGCESASVRPGKEPETVYSLKDDIPYVPTPIVVKDRMFVLSDRGVVTCVEAGSGKVLWKEMIGGSYYASPVSVNGKIYCASRQGEMVVFEAGPEFRLLARNRLPGKTFSTPAIANGRMYIRVSDSLICLGGKKKKSGDDQ